MRLTFRLAALGLALMIIVFWFFGGPNLGWTKTSLEEWRVDPITEIEYPVIEKRFVPGVDFLAVGLLGAGLLYGVSFAFRREKHA